MKKEAVLHPSTQQNGIRQNQESLSEKFAEAVLAEIKGRIEARGEKFVEQENINDLIPELSKYFLSVDCKLKKHKGIFLYGAIGSGKTILMQTILKTLRVNRIIYIPLVSCREIVAGFHVKGFESIEDYTTRSFSMQSTPRGDFQDRDKPRAYLFDDFGNEQDGLYYGSKINVMAEILLSRYSYFQTYGMTTHVTSNMGHDGDEIEKKYGTLLRSRMREMFNFVELKGVDLRK